MDYITTRTSLSPIRRGFVPGFANYKIRCTRLAATSDQVYQLFAHGRWFSLGTPPPFTTKTGRHDIAEILLKVALNTINQSNQIIIKGNTKSAIRHFLISPMYHSNRNLSRKKNIIHSPPSYFTSETK